jgi:hypothetical protein
MAGIDVVSLGIEYVDFGDDPRETPKPAQAFRCALSFLTYRAR